MIKYKEEGVTTGDENEIQSLHSGKDSELGKRERNKERSIE